MPMIMSSTATAAAHPANPAATTNPVVAGPITKNEHLKQQIGICLPGGVNSTTTMVEMSSSMVTTPTNNSLNLVSNPKNVTGTANNFYTATSTTHAGGHTLVLAKLNPTLSSTRQQTVILQPRMNATRSGATLQISQNPIKTAGGNIATSFATSAAAPISVRKVISGQTNHANTIPVLNLSTVTTTASASNSTNSVKQMITGQKFVAGNVETVNLVVASPNEVRNLKTNSTNNEIKNLYTVNKINGPKTLAGSAALVTQTPKMISISSNPGQSCATRVINLPKNFILTPGGPGITNMVSISSTNFTNRLPNQIIGRQQTVVNNAISQQQSTIPSNKPAIYTVNAGTNIITTLHQMMPNSSQTSTVAISNSGVSITTSALSSTNMSTKTSIQTINNISPVKATSFTTTHHQAIQSSPRPRILSRKRPIDSPTTITIKPTLQPPNGSLSFGTSNHQTSISQPNQNELHLQKLQSTMSNVLLEGQIIKTEASGNEINNNINLTTRKKPRKQLLEPSSPKSKSFYQCDQSPTPPPKTLPPAINNDHYPHHQRLFQHQQQPPPPPHQQQSYHSDLKDKVVVVKKPRPSLYNNCFTPTKFQHYLRYSDVKLKQEKKLTVPDVLNHIRKENEWKDYLLTDQCKRLAEDEKSFTLKKLELFLSTLEEEISQFSKCAESTTLYDDSVKESTSAIDRKCFRINDIVRANIQRSRALSEHFMECHQLINKVTHEHRDKVTNLAKKISNKRNGYFVK